jgi:Flp pilus assembly protein TadG
MKNATLSLLRSQSGSAGAEMALVTPLLLLLMFGSFELGNYFYSEHVVTKAVRDGARFASRSFALDANCSTPPTGIVSNTKEVTRTGQVSGGTARLAGWTNASTVTVALTCATSGAPVNNGIYKGLTGGIRVVKVTAAVPYTSLFATLGLSDGDSLTLNASSEAPVVGI